MSERIETSRGVVRSIGRSLDIDTLYDLYRDCALCPRCCHVDRTRGQLGFCGASSKVQVARAALHFWEEPPISGCNGSGTVFFAHCQLQCVYCQNAQISRPHIDVDANPWAKVTLNAQQLVRVFFNLEQQGANNINLVSATQYAPTVAHALHLARTQGLNIPVVYNTGGYECLQTLNLLDGYVDVYLTDLKHWEPMSAHRYAHAADYPQVAKRALAQMIAQTGAPVYEEFETGETVLVNGTIVRHLLLPGCLDEAESIVTYLGTEYGDRIVVSLMSQYVPLVDRARYPELAHRVSQADYDNLVDLACEFDFDECFMQEQESAQEDYIPSFDGEGVVGLFE